ncbi:DUF305 domain-containing protein [Nonomuraea basaltis]|uniref:DUF305 domain-containing protein n=1 Tax=Nonomuraea basaltis TaxID=2495887 RepID=UPI0014867142|nr:DUF305 domain-containing protein [Nonomuraea basaltis]
MRRSVIAGIAAGSVLATAVVTGVAVAAGNAQPPHATRWQQQSYGHDFGPMSGMWPMGRMHPTSVGSEFDYLAEMVAHHQEAVTAARQLQRSGRAEMRALGASIVKTQTAEIATMKTWLAAWYPGRSTVVDYQAMMRDLSRLSGDALDEAFLQDMIPHHMVAVMMSQQLLMRGQAEHGEVRAFAAGVRDAQHTEMFQMRHYLSDWFDGTWGNMPGMPGGIWGPH